MLAFHSKDYTVTSTFDLAMRVSKYVDASADLYKSFKNGLVNTIVFAVLTILAYFLVLPLGVVLGFWILRKRNYFVRNMKNECTEFSSPEIYAEYKNKLATLTKDKKLLQKVSNLDVKKIPFYAKFPVKQLKKLTSTILLYIDWMESRLKIYNTEHFISSNSVFVFKSERKLWEERNKAYSYWL